MLAANFKFVSTFLVILNDIKSGPKGIITGSS